MNEIPEKVVQQLALAAEAKLQKLKSKTLLIGQPGAYGWCQTAGLVSDANLSEFTTIILDIVLAFSQIGTSLASYQVDLIKRRLNAIEDWVEAGHTVIIVVRNIILLVGNAPTRANALPFFDRINYTQASGTQIEYCGGASAAGEVLRSWIGRLQYELVIDAPNLEPLLRVQRASKGSAQFVGGIVKKGAGRIVLVPPPTRPQDHVQYLQALANLPEQILGEPSELPAWAANFRTADETKALDNIAALKAQISEIENAIRMEEEKLLQADQLKTLFAASSDAFVAAVSNALTELGLRVIDGPHPRADLIALDDARGILVVEAKGLDGAAREANLRQAERWVADVRYVCTVSDEEIAADADLQGYAEKLTDLGISTQARRDINIKGAMVIGTYRKTPLDKRLEPDFPDPVMRVVSRSEVCALTGLQLLLMVLRARKDPTLKPKFIEQLFATSGQLDLKVSWKDFLVGPQLTARSGRPTLSGHCG